MCGHGWQDSKEYGHKALIKAIGHRQTQKHDPNKKGGVAMSSAFWIALSAIMLIMEAVTVGLTCIWLALGAFAAFIISFATANVYVQFLIFAAVSAISFASLRPFLKRFMPVKNNINSTSRLIGEKAVVTERITKMGGRIKVGDIFWMAESADGNDIETDSLVRITEAKSNKLIVEKI